MTRSETRREQEILQRSADTASSSAIPSSSTWSRGGLVGDDGQIGYAETPSKTAQDDVNVMKIMADAGLTRKEGLTASEDVELVRDLSLQPESDIGKNISVDSQVPNFFSSSPEKSSTASPEKASQVADSPSVRSGGNAKLHTKTLSYPEVVIEAPMTNRAGTSSTSVADSDEASLEVSTKKRKSEASSARPKSVASTGASVIESEMSQPSERAKRSTTKKVNYKPECDKDGREKKTKKGSAAEKAGKGKAPSRASSAASKKGKQQEVISLSSDEEGEASAEAQVLPARLGAKRGKGPKAASATPEQDDAQDADTSTQMGDDTTLVEEDTIGKDQECGDDDDDDAPLKVPKKGRGSNKTESNTVLSDGEGDAEDSEEEIVKTTKRGRPSSSGAKARGKKGAKHIIDDEDDEEEEEADTSCSKTNTIVNEDEEDADETAEAEAEAEEKAKTKKGKSSVLQDASAGVNAKSNGKAKEAKSGKRKREEEENHMSSAAASSSNSSNSSGKVNKNFFGKPLKMLAGFTKARPPGLIKRSIAPLLTIRSAPPAKREAIPLPKSKKSKKDAVMDSDEERELQEQRANETAEERMARFIRENEEVD